MIARSTATLGRAVRLIAVMTAIGLIQPPVPAQQPAAVEESPQPEGVEVLARGPVHEAFAETVAFNPQPGIIVPKAPPPPIEELPPDQKPEGANIEWIPGYWAWDADSGDFIWVSGVWRDLPPGRDWIPGYWSRCADGYQWTSGYWADDAEDEVEYLPPPPATLETGPSVAAPSPDDRWFPGCWVWRDDRYAWRAGYWARAHAHWAWVPSHYVWAPRGYIFVDGYWDYPARHRGVLFAPVRFEVAVYRRPHFSYEPATVIDLAAFHDHLFVRPHDYHYYFGDYYAARYRDEGMLPAYSFHRHDGYDPIYAHQRWEHRDDPQWEHQHQEQFEHRRDDAAARPAHTLADQLQRSRREGAEKENPPLAMSLTKWAQAQRGSVQFQRLGQDERHQLVQRGSAVQRFQEERQKLEERPAGGTPEKPAQEPKPTRVKVTRSPIVAKSPAQLGKDQAPPQRHVVPEPKREAPPKRP